MSSPRVLFVTHSYPRDEHDSAGSFVHRLARSLVAIGSEVRVLAPRTDDAEHASEIDGVEVKRFRFAPRSLERRAPILEAMEDLPASLSQRASLATLIAAGTVSVVREVESFKPDIIHAMWWLPSGMLATGGAMGVPTITTLIGADVRLARHRNLAERGMRRVLEASSKVTAISEWLAGEARAVVPQADITVIPMPVDTSIFRGERHARVPGRFLFVGILSLRRGVGDVIEALAWAPQDATLEIIGDGPDNEKLREMANRLGVTHRILWRGRVPRSRIAESYSSAQSLIACTTSAGQGLATVEAQLCRTPVIGYRTGALPELVSSEWGGTLVPRGDVKELASAIRSAMEKPELLEGSGTIARARMIDKFAPSGVAARYLDLYTSVLRNS